jgi:hypothetical protein
MRGRKVRWRGKKVKESTVGKHGKVEEIGKDHPAGLVSQASRGRDTSCKIFSNKKPRSEAIGAISY